MAVSGAKPSICISLDHRWIYRLGADWFTYRRLIQRDGGAPLTVTSSNGTDVVNDGRSDGADVPHFDGLPLGGGVDVALSTLESSSSASRSISQRDRFELGLIEQAVQHGRPILGICRGCQLLNVAFGGTLRSLPTTRLHRDFKRGLKHPVVIKRASRLHQILRTRRLAGVRSLHRQAVDKRGDAVRFVARGPDGVAEAIERVAGDGRQWWCIGVQWHPELVAWGSPDRELIASFVRASKRASQVSGTVLSRS